MPLCLDDYSFGPGVSCRTLDFTVLFSNIFLGFVPALVFAILAAPRVVYISKSKRRRLLPWTEIPLKGWALLVVKSLLSLILLGAASAVWATWEKTDSLRGQWSGWTSGAFEVVAALLILVLNLQEHIHCGRPSQLPQLYLLVSSLFTASRLRTISLLSNNVLQPVAPLALSLAARILLFVTLQVSNRASLSNAQDIPPIGTAGIVSRYLVTWVLPLLWRGYKRPLGLDDLGAIETTLYSARLWDQLSPKWAHEQARHVAGQTRQPLFWALAKAYSGLIIAPILPSLIYSVTSMARPLIINRTILFVESYSTSDPYLLADGWGLVGAAFLSYSIFAMATALAQIAIQRSSLAVRGALMEALYHKLLKIRVETARDMGAAKASNLMSVDVNNITTNIGALHDIYSALLMTGLGLYIIWTQIGVSFVASVVGAVVFFALVPILTKNVGTGRAGWAKATDVRVKFMSSVLKHIKAIKLSAYEATVTQKAESLRAAEIQALIVWIKEILKISIVTNWLGNFLALITIIVFTVVSLFTSGTNDGVTTARIFAVISVISLISEPLLMFGQRIGSITTAWASFKRIEEFLLCEERTQIDGDVDGVGALMEAGDGLQMKGTSECRIEMVEAKFGVKDKAELLRGFDIHMVNPALWMITGRVGSGKSVFLQALLGELDLLNGSVSIHLGTVGYCSQDPWLRMNSSIRENITFMCPYEPSWYATVVGALGLDVDILQMADGDGREVASLSGGQKQRVALARAVYGKFDTLILDDPFSALDADTEAHVFNALLGPRGLLNGKPVILATNQVYRLSASSCVTVLSDGEAVEHGPYTDLLAHENGVMAALVRDFVAGEKKKAKEGSETGEDGEEREIKDSLDEPVVKGEKKENEGKQGKVAWSTYLLYVRGMGTGHAIFWLAFAVIAAAIQTTISVYLQAWTTSLPGSPRSQYGAFLGGYSGMQIGYLVAFCIGIAYAFVYAHPIASARLHSWQIRGLLSTPLDFFEKRGVGEMINRFNSDLNIIDMQLPNSVVNCMFEVTFVLGGAILIIAAAPYMAAVMVGTAVTMVLIQRFYVRAGRELRRLDLTTKSPIYSLFSETVDTDGLRTIRAMRAQEGCLALMTERCTTSQFPAWLVMAVRKWLELALNLLVTLVNTLLVLIAVANRHSTSAGILAVALTEAASMNSTIGLLVTEWTQVEMSITSVERIQEYIELPAQETASSSKLALSIERDWLKRGAIALHHVTARYRPDLPPALHDVTFNIKPGQRVGICGRSGSGKSTLLGVLWRLIDMDDDAGSRVFIDGVDIREVPLPLYRSSMTIIPQDPLLLELSLRENLDPEGLHDDAEIWAALDQAQLKAHIENMPEKLDEMISSDGGAFSRGQRQLLALARAILRRRPILALDEATSSIDVRTDALVQQTVREAFAETTVLTIAHRISTIMDYDVVIVMEAGRVVEIGPPDELLQRVRGVFRRLAIESGAFQDEQVTPGFEDGDEIVRALV
ncbi:P-loop containing nucleoside triphosphate hydrolase protein [Naematelia encephala]|uniref:p-loop containing nucleoside triphosphate hydrolase protein n=1 Tax=Naematelia encephala TaxID=71784 RepID=A0A1Y2AYT7_9TREE|nr:P-loop containing nucleoside triphosphate hydrolase protein [Naematelia encephala]